MAPLLEVENLVKHFHVGVKTRVYAVNDVSFTLEQGETLALVGESGSGKTTVGRCILRTVHPTSGAIRFRGKDILALGERRFRRLRPKLQMVFQDPFDQLDPRMIIGEIIREPLRHRPDVPRSEQGRIVLDLANKVALAYEFLERLPRELSAGQQQRVGIARALAMNPELVVLDEAVANLDASHRFEIVQLLRRLQQELGLSYIFISHDLDTVRHIADRIALMYLGKIVEVGPAAEVFREQLHPYSRALLSAVLRPDPRAQLPAYVLKGELPSPTRLPPGCALASRCPEARAGCVRGQPPMIATRPDHAASCFLLDPSTFPVDEPADLAAMVRA
jgi:oligopeptide/dipeptide ABC transporter ATP-binding protein